MAAEDTATRYWAVDIGGTKVEVGVGTTTGEWLATRRVSTGDLGSGVAIIGNLAKVLQEVAREAGGASPVAVGVGCPGPLDVVHGKILKPGNLPQWHDLPVVHGLADALHVPAFLDNDATAAGIGEWRFGAGRGADDVVYLTVSTGIGAGIILDGQVVEGATMNAGEAGHVMAVQNGIACHCGRRGCLETVASGTAIGRIGEERRSTSPALRAVQGPVDASAVFAAAKAGDAVAMTIVDETTSWLAWGVGMLINLFNPARVIIGGGVAIGNGEALVEPIREKLPLYAMGDLLRACQVVEAELGDKTGVAGALAVAVSRMESRGTGL